jgi:hypothetical protein
VDYARFVVEGETMRSALIWMSAALASVHCGGGDAVTSPPVAAPVTLAVTNGLTGASVVTNGPASAPQGSPVRLTAPGFLPRETTVPASGAMALWPITASEDFVKAVVYPSDQPYLSRWERSVLTVSPLFPAAVLAAVNGLQIVRLDVVTGRTPDIELIIDAAQLPSASTVGLTRGDVAGGALSRVTIILRSERELERQTVVHELGHALGLFGHSPRRSDVMHATSFDASWFTADEIGLLTMMYKHRRIGNTFPDADAHLPLASSSVRTFVIVD